MDQPLYPIYFNAEWYTQIFEQFQEGDTPRDYFNSFFTALFNAWQNYQNLYGKKRYIVGQMTLRQPGLYRQNHDNFRSVYPEGKMVFMARQPEDWLASAIHLRFSTPFSQNPHEIISYYKTIMKQAIELAEQDDFIVFEFEDLVLKPENTMKQFAAKIGISWNEQLLSPTFNGAPFYQNSSFQNKRQSAIDPAVLGRGKQLDPSVSHAIDSEAQELYRQLLTYAGLAGLT